MKTQGNVAGEAVNSPSEKPVRTRSRFPSLSYHLYNTERFGEYNVPFVMDCIEGDKVPIRSGGRVSSYNLKAPLMQSLSKKKDFYMVPMEAILPKNWQKFYTNPTIGDDVPDDCGPGVSDFWSKMAAFIGAAFSQVDTFITDSSPDPYHMSNALFRALILGEYVYSSGSLLKTLGTSGQRYAGFVYNNKYYSYDSFFDLVVTAWMNTVEWFEFKHDGETFVCVLNETTYGYKQISNPVVSFRAFLQMMRDDLSTYIVTLPSGIGTIMSNALAPYFDNSNWVRTFAVAEISYDLRRLWAYQLVVSHFYSNDHIDYVYSADLFRNLVDYLTLADVNGNYDVDTFTWNGMKLPYDSMSAHYFDVMITKTTTSISNVLDLMGQTDATSKYYRNHLAYFSTLFSYRRSLRYVDYFTGSRSRPLAVGDVNVNVNSNLVNVVDVSRNIQRQRFFNAVNRFGRRFEEYIKGLSGVTPDTDYHNPLYLSHVSDTVYGVETENTGVAQQTQGNSITSRFQTNGSRYQFEFEVDRPCVVIGLCYYDMPRAYLFATERQSFYMNRFDMFNPYMQFIGDQDVKKEELGASYVTGVSGTFGYQLRHMEYKQRFDQAAGGFIEDLPGFLFTDRVFGALPSIVVDPHFIRSLNSELDPFYVSMTGYSLGHYFHFIVDNDNVCDASRPMAFAPSIL